MNEDEKIEYEQLSADWRHRDSLTWQMPAVLLVISGVLVGEGFGLLNSKVNPWVVETLFLFALAFAIMLTIALRQNLGLQKKNRIDLESINPYTPRFGFPLRGSWTLYYLSFAISEALILLNIMTLLLIYVPEVKRALLNVS